MIYDCFMTVKGKKNEVMKLECPIFGRLLYMKLDLQQIQTFNP